MLVTQVTELSKSRSKVYIDQEFAFVLYKGELRLYHIKESEELRPEDYRTIMHPPTECCQCTVESTGELIPRKRIRQNLNCRREK